MLFLKRDLHGFMIVQKKDVGDLYGVCPIVNQCQNVSTILCSSFFVQQQFSVVMLV